MAVTADELADLWRPLTPIEKANAEKLIRLATAWIRKNAPGADETTADDVVLDVVRSAMETGKYSAFVSFSRTVGGVSQSGTLANPGEHVVFTAFHRELLGIGPALAPRFSFGDRCVW